MNNVKCWSIAELRYAGGAEHDVKYVSEVDYSALATHVEGAEDSMNRAYAQRNTMAVALVKMALLLGWPAGRGVDGREGWPIEWRQVVYVQLPGGEQVSYHIAPSEQHLLADLPEFTGDWDGNYTGTEADWPKSIPVCWRDMGKVPDLDQSALAAVLQAELDQPERRPMPTIAPTPPPPIKCCFCGAPGESYCFSHRPPAPPSA